MRWRRIVVRSIRARPVLTDSVAAVSVGIVKGEAVLDLDYVEDVDAQVDMNVVMTGGGRFVEVQGTGEEATFSEAELTALYRNWPKRHLSGSRNFNATALGSSGHFRRSEAHGAAAIPYRTRFRDRDIPHTGIPHY